LATWRAIIHEASSCFPRREPANTNAGQLPVSAGRLIDGSSKRLHTLSNCASVDGHDRTAAIAVAVRRDNHSFLTYQAKILVEDVR